MSFLRGSQHRARVNVLNSKFKFISARPHGGWLALVMAALSLFSFSDAAYARLQCVPYARAQSGIDIYGDARTWWQQAAGVYARGDQPKVGAVMAIAASGAMPMGHVAVVSKVVDERHVLIDHANWSRPGMIERGVLAVDVSAAGDWSEVRIWYAPSGSLGLRSNRVSGFIYPEAPHENSGGSIQLANADMAVTAGKANM